MLVAVQVHDHGVRAERTGLGVRRGFVVVRQGRGARKVTVAPQGCGKLRTGPREGLAGSLHSLGEARPAPLSHRRERGRAHLPAHGLHGHERLAVHAVRRGNQRERVGDEEVEQLHVVTDPEDPLGGALPPRRHLLSSPLARAVMSRHHVPNSRRLHRFHDVHERRARFGAHHASEQERAGNPRHVHARGNLPKSRTSLEGGVQEERLDLIRVSRVEDGRVNLGDAVIGSNLRGRVVVRTPARLQ